MKYATSMRLAFQRAADAAGGSELRSLIRRALRSHVGTFQMRPWRSSRR